MEEESELRNEAMKEESKLFQFAVAIKPQKNVFGWASTSTRWSGASRGWPGVLASISFLSSRSPGVQGYLTYKNDLHGYAQRFGLQLPSYSLVNEGVDHAPKFRASVVIDGEQYASYERFPTQKDAEQNVARIALNSIHKRIKDEANSFIYEDKLFSKSILVEFAVKLELRRPTYETSCSAEGSSFVSRVFFKGKNYPGTPGRNKKEAEQIAARAAIQSLLASSDSSSATLLARIIKSKFKLVSQKPSDKRKAAEQAEQDQIREPKKLLLTNSDNGSNGRSGRMVRS